MKAWMKFLVLAVVLLVVSWIGLGVLFPSLVVMKITFWSVTAGIIAACLGGAALICALCILYELGKMWYQGSPLNTSWAADLFHRFKTWLGRDGLK